MQHMSVDDSRIGRILYVDKLQKERTSQVIACLIRINFVQKAKEPFDTYDIAERISSGKQNAMWDAISGRYIRSALMLPAVP